MFKFDYIDHVAYAFKTIQDGYTFFRFHPGFQICKGPGINDVQAVRYLFVKVDGLGTIEILSPVDSLNPSPLNNQLSISGPGFNHICYAVLDIESSIKELCCLGWNVVCNPTPDVAFSGRRIAFLNHKVYGLIELLESICDFGALLNTSNISSAAECNALATASINNYETSTSSMEIPSSIIQLINISLDTEGISPTISSFQELKEWDSLSHAIFHSSFETLLGVRLDTSKFTSLQEYLNFYFDRL